MREPTYEIGGSDRLDGLLAKVVKLAEEADVDVTDFLRDCVGGIAAHYAWMVNDFDHDAADVWDLHHEPFEAGVKIGAALEEGDRLWVTAVSDDEVEPDVHLGASWAFWLCAPSEEAALHLLEEGVGPWLRRARAEAGLLPFQDPMS